MKRWFLRLKNILEMTKQDFYDLLNDDELKEAQFCDEFTSVVIIPTDFKHESGFNIMNFVLLGKNGVPIYKLTNITDVFRAMNDDDWVIDCLPCGFLRFYNTKGKNMKLVFTCPTFEIECCE